MRRDAAVAAAFRVSHRVSVPRLVPFRIEQPERCEKRYALRFGVAGVGHYLVRRRRHVFFVLYVHCLRLYRDSRPAVAEMADSHCICGHTPPLSKKTIS